MTWIGAKRAIGRLLQLGLLIGLAWLANSLSLSAQASPLAPDTYYTQAFTQLVKAEESRSDRIQAISDCLPSEFNQSDVEMGDRLSKDFDALQTDEPRQPFGLSNDPQLNQTSDQFKKCLEQQQIPTTRSENGRA